MAEIDWFSFADLWVESCELDRQHQKTPIYLWISCSVDYYGARMT